MPDPRDDLDWLIALEKNRLEGLELRCEKAGYRDAAKRIYDARLRLSEAIDALAAAGPSPHKSEGEPK